jgi:hypothetical protein
MRVFLFGMALAGLLLGSASQVTNQLLMWADVIVATLLMIGAISSLLTKRG